VRRISIAALLALLALTLAPAAQAGELRPVGWGPISDQAAAEKVRGHYEPRPQNRGANHRVPSELLLRKWRRQIDMPYERFVTGRYRGTTDRIIQWAALKWGLPRDLLRAVAVKESWWEMTALGDNGDSFGLFQVRRPYHCRGGCRIARRFTAWNADYYGGIIRAYFDGKMDWLNTVERGKQYRPGDIWGSVGAWFSGRWWTPDSRTYIQAVRTIKRERTWRARDFRSASGR
jgi:hypothetical protein